MSRSQPSLTNPAKYFMSWSGSTGILSWYNKEKKENIPVRLPFRFLVLDQLATIKGYNKQAKAGYWSNEVRNTRKEELHVRLGNQTVFVGMYKNEQDIVQVPKGADYTQSVYVAHMVNNEWVISNINMKGSARSAWFDFTSTCRVENGTVIMSKGDVQEAQTGDFYPPKFVYEPSTPEEDAEAVRLDKELQIYLSQYLAAAENNRGTQEELSEIDDEAITDGVDMSAELSDEEIEQMPKDKQGPAKAVRNWDRVGKKGDDEEPAPKKQTVKQDTVIEDFGDEPIDLSEIPF